MKKELIIFGTAILPFIGGGLLGWGIPDNKNLMIIGGIVILISYICLRYSFYLKRNDKW